MDWRNWSVSDWGNAVWLGLLALGPIVAVALVCWAVARMLWRGEFSLPVAFWLFFVVGNFIVQPVVLYAVLWLLHLFVDKPPAPVKVTIIAAMWIYFAVSAVGVWVSARRNISKPVWRDKMWGWAARCVVLLLAITTWGAILLDEATWH